MYTACWSGRLASVRGRKRNINGGNGGLAFFCRKSEQLQGPISGALCSAQTCPFFIINIGIPFWGDQKRDSCLGNLWRVFLTHTNKPTGHKRSRKVQHVAKHLGQLLAGQARQSRTKTKHKRSAFGFLLQKRTSSGPHFWGRFWCPKCGPPPCHIYVIESQFLGPFFGTIFWDPLVSVFGAHEHVSGSQRVREV